MSDITYPFDPTGVAVSNLIIGEQHSVTEANYRDYFFIIPKFAPFFTNNFNLVLTLEDGSSRTLTEGVDYAFALYYLGATRSIGMPVYGAITFSDVIRSGIVTLNYQSLGGDYVTDPSTVIANLAELAYNPRTANWDVVTDKPSVFPPINHNQDLSNFFDEGDIITALNSVATAIANRQPPVISLGTQSTVNPTVDYYSILPVEDEVYAGEPVYVTVFCDGTIVQPVGLFFTIWHDTTSDENVSPLSGTVEVHQYNGEWVGDIVLNTNFSGNDPLNFAVQLRVGSVTGPIVAMSNSIQLNPPRVVVDPGTETVMLPVGIPGLLFNDDYKNTGYKLGIESGPELFYLGKTYSIVDQLYNRFSELSFRQIFYFGNNAQCQFILSEDGNFILKNDAGYPMINSEDLVQYVELESELAALDSTLRNYIDNSAQIQLTNVTGVLPITQGGTGATNAVDALAALGAYPSTNPNNYIKASQAPVQTVAGRTGNVTLNVSDIGNFPTKLSQFTNDQQYITATGAPVQSVAGRTGNILLSTNDVSGLSLVAVSNSYSDLINKPTKLSQFTNDVNYVTAATAPVTSVAGRAGAVVLSASDVSGLSVVATSGSYSDLSNKPVIPTTISQLANDVGYITAAGTSTYSGNLTGGEAGQLVYQAGTDFTSYVPNGTVGQYLSVSVSGTPYWVSAGIANGLATLGPDGKLTAAQIPSTLLGAVQYQGVWDASANLPELLSGIGVKGQYYKVSVAGTVTIDGISQWNAGDMIIFNGLTWDKIDGIGSEVTSVAGRTGAVVLTANDISGLATVATTGSYTDLINKPVIPTSLSQLSNDMNFVSNTDTIALSTSISGGLKGQLLYQSSPNTTSFVAQGTLNQVLIIDANGLPTWTSLSNLTINETQITTALGYTPVQQLGDYGVGIYWNTSGPGSFGISLLGNQDFGSIWPISITGDADKAISIIGGAPGQILYQTATDVTSKLPIGTEGQILTVQNGLPTWLTQVTSDVPATNVTGLATVATTGSYADLINTPSLLSQFANDTNFITLANLATVAASGSYSDLINTPTKLSQFANDTAYLTATGTIAKATNLDQGSLYSIPYQSNVGVTSFLAPSTNGFILSTNNTNGAPSWINPNSLILQSSQITTALGFTPVNTTSVGVANGLATLGADGKLSTNQIPAALVGAVQYQGVWNAATNVPALASGVGTKGQYYKVSVAGTTLIDGNNQWNAGDMIIYDGTVWDKIDGISSEVISVAGRTGVVVLAQADISGLTTTSSPTFAAVTAATFTGALVGNADTATAAFASTFFTQASGAEGRIGAAFTGQNNVYIFNNASSWGISSTSGGNAFAYDRATAKFTFNGALNGNANTATYLSATQQTNIITGMSSSMTMAQDGIANGSFTCRSTGAGDNNLAGMVFYNDSYAIKMGVRADGYFGFGGWSRGTWSWYSDGSGNTVAAGNVTAYSDPRLKDNVNVIDSPFDILDNINGVTFVWNNRSKLVSNKTGKRDYGVLANEVKAVMPEIISQSIPDEENGEVYDTVSYEKIVPVLIEATKQLKQENQTLRQELEEIKQLLNELKNA